MYKILRKEKLNSQVTLLEIDAPFVARKAEPGQFVILRAHEEGERIPSQLPIMTGTGAL